MGNVLLQRKDKEPFVVTQMTIKAPGVGFTAPIGEGLVFVLDSPDDIHKTKVR
jgi:hypothetical protein